MGGVGRDPVAPRTRALRELDRLGAPDPPPRPILEIGNWSGSWCSSSSSWLSFKAAMGGGGLCAGCGRWCDPCFVEWGTDAWTDAEEDGWRLDNEERMLDWVWEDEVSRSRVDCGWDCDCEKADGLWDGWCVRIVSERWIDRSEPCESGIFWWEVDRGWCCWCWAAWFATCCCCWLSRVPRRSTRFIFFRHLGKKNSSVPRLMTSRKRIKHDETTDRDQSETKEMTIRHHQTNTKAISPVMNVASSQNKPSDDVRPLPLPSAKWEICRTRMKLTYRKQYQGPLDLGPISQHIFHLYTSQPCRTVDRFAVPGHWWTHKELSQWEHLHLVKHLNLKKEIR